MYIYLMINLYSIVYLIFGSGWTVGPGAAPEGGEGEDRQGEGEAGSPAGGAKEYIRSAKQRQATHLLLLLMRPIHTQIRNMAYTDIT